ncbi:hypothetical protein [Shewanella algae]|uniref:hypothetical protein n=1 Tax=Shewanella algae TaxID=38313 RepID=UPI001AAFB517|nr:hypothetical protein [Shewanella algae]EKT4489748.1 hypothetical protein [Shewanella algae]MBO2548707.1 hypothetical protein [Shewanella algae]
MNADRKKINLLFYSGWLDFLPTELSFSYLSSLCSPQGFDNPDSFDSDLSALQEKAKAVEESKNLLKENMKKELNEI